jgi:carbamate kinase
MRIVVALGGNALLQRHQPMTAEAQLANIRVAAIAIADVARDHHVVIAHGNGPQVGLMALQTLAHAPDAPWPLDVLGAETEGMIGYQIEQELMNVLPVGSQCATLLTRVEVGADDLAFGHPTKPIGPVYPTFSAAGVTAQRQWIVQPQREGGFRRVVPSPQPIRILNLRAIQLLVDANITVICAGGGGIPVMKRSDGRMEGVEAVIDKDRTAALLARGVGAQVLLMLTDVEAVFEDFGEINARAISETTPEQLDRMTFAEGSMAPKIAAACDFVRAGGQLAGIGRLEDARAIIEGRAGTRIRARVEM